MSTNLVIYAEREIFYKHPETGELVPETQTEYWRDEWQTPTADTDRILASADPLEAYIEWARSVSKSLTQFVYAEDDVFCVGEPIGTEMYNPADDHIEGLQAWVELQRRQAFVIKFGRI